MCEQEVRGKIEERYIILNWCIRPKKILVEIVKPDTMLEKLTKKLASQGDEWRKRILFGGS